MLKMLWCEQKNFVINQYNRWIFAQVIGDCRERKKSCNSLHATIVANKIEEVTVIDTLKNKPISFAFSEGLALSNYQFLKYFKDKKPHSLKTINLYASMEDADAEELQAIINGTFIARDLVNEPLSYLSAMQYSQDIEAYGKIWLLGRSVHKKKIETLKMGGL